ncbi:MAG: hypothetical protein R2752_13510 [Vicinamibacterales bacterium]
MKTLRRRKKLIEVALPRRHQRREPPAKNRSATATRYPALLVGPSAPLAAARAVIFPQMVDDPSEYLDVLRSDPKLVRKAEAGLRARMKVWEQARDLAEKPRGTSARPRQSRGWFLRWTMC